MIINCIFFVSQHTHQVYKEHQSLLLSIEADVEAPKTAVSQMAP